jgi:2-keto-4-pentenoate hydratase/2-oxohepta-3-ene-1,7-dioic acid hydratase in catechol pathway
MKLASFIANGLPAYGAVVGDGIVTLSDRLDYPTLRDALAAGALDEMRAAVNGPKPDRPLAGLQFFPAIPNPEKIICVGINYRSHAAEVGRELPVKPSVFLRLANTLTGHDGEMIRPRVSDHFDFEGELAVVIGKGGRHIRPEQALAHVAGYSCFVDGSVRDYQKHSVAAGKNFPATGPLGPWVVTTDEIPDPSKLTLTTRLNGQVMQHATTDQLIHPVAEIVAYCSAFTPLVAGDVIATGTPEGVGHGRKPPVWMKPGDVLEVEISGIGVLRSRVVAEK